MRTSTPFLTLLVVLAALTAAPSLAEAQTTTPEAVVYFSELTELRVRLPAGWDGTHAVNEATLPGRATYRWEATAAPLAGTVVVVERVVGLNPLMQERWRRGQVASGYYGLRPTGAVPDEDLAFGPGAAFEIAGGETIGRVYFVQRGEVFWSVHVSAPAGVIAAVPPLLDGIARGIRVSAKTVPPQQASR
ncbi:hypothetical protein [Rubricoccus marinus]|uniref:DUF4136 domain-containing protein n=1 Tax=Rubricoccus marinus TaxID=716817 RepID=A0A259TX54_9BACT|nr:hypothetical protein [Rubricoccus marinus]OZC02276.1 hypothetical protein BSZ36_04320 [Rubricoccus marinus]